MNLIRYSKILKYKIMKYYRLIVFVLVLILLHKLKERASNISYEKSIDTQHAKELKRLRLEKSVLQEKRFGCKMPQLDPYAPEIMKFDNVTPKIVCEGEKDWVECYLAECRVKDEILKNMKVSCVYQDIEYIDDFKNRKGWKVRTYGDEIYKLSRSDHVKVSCTGNPFNSSWSYRTLWNGLKAGFRPLPRQVKWNDNPSAGYDVLMLVFDTASHNGFLRRMPNAYRYLKNEMGAVVLKGHNIVGDGSRAALFALLAGKSELELPEARKSYTHSKGNRLDPKDFIFHTMSQAGYRTAFFEDMPDYGAFQYKHNGFRSQPADHYLRTLVLEDYRTRTSFKDYCVGANLEHVLMLNLTAQFFDIKQKHFIFTMFSTICHDNFNMVTAAEDDFLYFLRQFKSSGRLNNTLLMVMGDHGVRHDKEIRKTYQGKIEERMPFLAIALPERLKMERPQALPSLRANVDVLTTPYDVHATVLDVVGLERDAYRIAGADMERALSLIRAVPGARSCGAASIEPAWCACARWAPVRGHMRRRVADALAAYVNLLLLPVRSQCAERVLTSIDWVTVLQPNEEMLRYVQNADTDAYEPSLGREFEHGGDHTYQARIVMGPGDGVFEATLTHKSDGNQIIVNERSISRNSRYGDQPKCIMKTHPLLKKYCYCKDYSPPTTPHI